MATTDRTRDAIAGVAVGVAVAAAAACVSGCGSAVAELHATATVRLPEPQHAPPAPPDDRSQAGPPLSPCDLVREHNLALLREASTRAYAILKAKEPGYLTKLAEAGARVASYGKVEVSTAQGLRRLDTLDDTTLHILGMTNRDATIYLEAKEAHATGKAAATALEAGEPLTPTNPGAFDVELCNPDRAGAWAYWTTEAAYIPDEVIERWELGRRITLARVSNGGAVTLASRLPTFLHATPTRKNFPAPLEDNCCTETYGVGEPRVLFEHDQDGDGVPEIGIKAEYAVEGTVDVATFIYRFDGDVIHEDELPVDSMEDVDQDGRLDVLARDQVAGPDQCGSGFPSYCYGLPYLGHALPDGSYSFTDAAARAYLKKQCPAQPRMFSTIEDVWCGKAWGVDPAVLLRSALARCAKDPCAPRRKLEACERLEFAAKLFTPPLVLE